MTTHIREPVELATVRRGRSSTAKSTGLDYTSSHRVDEDILFRIRALLLSRNEICPPRTPHTSDEHQACISVDSDTTSGDRFDFSTAKSVARIARIRTALHLPRARRSRAITEDSTMDPGASQRFPEPKVPITKRLTLRSTSSANDLKGLIDDAKLHETDLTCCPPCDPEDKKFFRLPRLVLKDKKKPDYTPIRSCGDFNLQPSNPEERSVRETTSSRGFCSDSTDERSPTYVDQILRPVVDSIQPEAADFRCFMAGCSPGPAECKKHRRRSSQPPITTKPKHVIRGDIDAIARGIAEDVAKLSLAVKDAKSKGRSASPNGNRRTEASRSSPGPQDSPTAHKVEADYSEVVESSPDPAKSPGRRDSPTIPEPENEAVTAVVTTPDRIKSPALSAASSDVFPHAMRSREAEAIQSLSATIVTNFSLPGPKVQNSQPKELNRPGKDSIASLKSNQDQPVNFVRARFSENSLSSKVANAPSAPIRSKESHASLNSKPKSPSLLSGASRMSARHALLKPSVSPSSPVDTGLPIPPILTQAAVNGTDKPDDVFNDQKKVSPAMAHLATLQKAKDLVSGVEEKIREAADAVGKELPYKNAPSTELVVGEVSEFNVDLEPSRETDDPLRKLSALIETATAIKEPPVKTPLKSLTGLVEELVDSEIAAARLNPALPRAESPNAAYWGFVPAVNDAVQDAVQVAIKDAVQVVALPPGTERDKAAEAYRKLVGVSLAQAAESADEYLRRASLWDNLATSQPVADIEPDSSKVLESAGQSHVEPLKRSSLQSNVNRGSNPRAPSHSGQRGSVSPNENQEPYSMYATPEHMETVPLESVDETVVENHKQGWKIWTKGSSPAYTAIPTRKSSRNHMTKSKNSGTNSSAVISPKAVASPKRARTSEAKALRSISSLGSLHSVGSEKDRGTKRGASSEGAEANYFEDVEKSQMNQKLGRKNTVHWLRELLTNEGPYEPRLTELPPRARRDQNLSSGRVRSRTAPDIPIAELFLGATPKPVDQQQPQQLQPNLDTKAAGPMQTAASETFTKTINDLEHLLNEALFIARQAADREDAAYVPRLFGNATAILRGGRKGFEGDNLAESVGRDRAFSTAYDSKQADNISEAGSLPSVHESCRSYSGSSDSDMSDDDKTADEGADEPFIGEAVPQIYIKSQPTVDIVISPEKRRASRESGWPPTGRHLTPFPPGSAVISQRGSSNTLAPSYVQEESSSLSSSVKAISSFEGKASLMNDALDENSMVIDDVHGEPTPDDRVRDVNPFDSQPSANKQSSSKVSPKELSPKKKVRSRAETIPAGRKSQQLNFCIDEHLVGEDIHESDAKSLPIPPITPRLVSIVAGAIERRAEYDQRLLTGKSPRDSVPSKREVRDHITAFRHPPIQPRISSLNLRKQVKKEESSGQRFASSGHTYSWQNVDREQISAVEQVPPPAVNQRLDSQHPSSQYTHSFDGMSNPSDALDFETGYGHKHSVAGNGMITRGTGAIAGNGIVTLGSGTGGSRQGVELKDIPDPNLTQQSGSRRRPQRPSPHLFNLSGRNHVSLRGEHHKGFSLTRSHKRQAIARDWAPARKRFVASVACISTALVGILVGIYAAEVPAIQYYIVDFHHYTILGNVFFFIGLAISTFFFWPLPLLHGRKPYILGSMCLAMPLLFPQALAVGEFRSPYVAQWRVALLLPRAVMGFVLGFANMNFKSTLTDLFGASLQSANPHQEVVDENDVRRHGGGLGVWLGIWTWCSIASVGIGFLIGAVIINNANPAWGFYISICIIAGVLLLNVVCPEVRRSAFRRSVAEVKNGDQVSRRLARGEVKMHMVKSGPKWWGQEFHYGTMLSASMLRQPGFLVLALYVGWIYGQIVLIVVLLGSLLSKYYQFKSPYIGASVAAVPLGALLSVPFQKAGLLSRDRTHAEISDDDTRDKKVGWSSHLVRRAIFVLCLPFAGLAYTLSSNGPPIPFILPIIFAALIGFLSNLGLAECHGIIMETFDTSDLQPGMTGRPRRSNNDSNAGKRTNYSSFPRVTSAFAITQGFGYLVAAIATGVGGVAERHIGQQAATGVMAGILLILSLLLLGVLVRFREIQIIPDMHKAAMERYMNARRASAALRGEGNIQDEDIRPVIIGNPTHLTRRMCILEMGGLSRWSEIRKKNHLVDQNSLEAKHPNLAVMRDMEERIIAKEQEIVQQVRRSLSREGSRRSRLSAEEQLEGYRMGEQGDLGGHREMMGQGNGVSRGGTEKTRSRGRRKTTIRE